MRLTFGNLSIEGVSRGGDRTWFRVHPPGLAFDVGRGALGLAGARDVFITHGHIDHCLGLPFLLSHRARHEGGATRVACPAEIASTLGSWLESAARLEQAEYDYELIGMAAGDRLAVGSGLQVEAFASHHVVPSLGYDLVRTRRRLAPEFRGAPGAELADLRRQGVEIEQSSEEVWLSYTGDTAISLLDARPELYTSRILLIECTFLAPEHRPRAARYGHVHLEDLAERADRFTNEQLVLCHLSRRHSVTELRRAVEQQCGALAERVEYAIA